jgi:K(+)-stimulated pyrophosphate-energized sodium pump
MELSVIIIIAMSILSLITAAVFTSKVITIKVGGVGGKDTPEDVKLKTISAAIAEGAMAFLMREYKVISIFIAVMTVVIFFLLDNPKTPDFNEGLFTAIAFISGAIISCVSGFIGMRIATMGNVRTAQAAKESISKAFRVAFDSGAVMGFGLIGMAILGLIALFFNLHRLLPWNGKTYFDGSSRWIWSWWIFCCFVCPCRWWYIHKSR